MNALRRALLLAVLAAAAASASPAAAHAGTVKVMTRNLYLGADLTPATRASSLQGLVDAAGVILAQVDENDFRVRARGLAAEILRAKPDLVGLQEAALWRTAPCTENPLPPAARQVRYDYLRLLLDRLNAGGRRYRLVVSQDEFDFEVYVDADGNASTSAPGCPLGSELNGRLTMRDAILARSGRVTTRRARGGHFRTLLQVRPGGVAIDVTRGWTRVDAKVPGAPPFRFVNTHLEAFDSQASNHTNQGTDVGNGQVREAQAQELAAPGGPARAARRVILVGDLNSDVATEVKPGDGLAYRALLRRGFVERSTSRPLSCCLRADVLTIAGGGSRADFDHKVDHIMTSAPGTVRLIRSGVTGLRPVNGFWNSDHAGVFSSLRVFAAARPRFTG